MKIIKHINNNYAIAIDKNGNQLIVSGKGIGFGQIPRELEDMSKVNRSYYDIDEIWISMINNLPENIIEISSLIVDKARILIDNPLSSNIVFSLADHINFSIERYEKHMDIKLPIAYDIQQLFEKEYEVDQYGLKLIREKLNVWMPREEAGYIALHIINAEEQCKSIESLKNETIINDIKRIIEDFYDIHINENSSNYARFISHMNYLFKRNNSTSLLENKNNKLFEATTKEYKKTYQCVQNISLYLKTNGNINLTDEEKLYLILHVNRLCTREDCNH